jgi:carboxyl-terminal processing protease
VRALRTTLLLFLIPAAFAAGFTFDYALRPAAAKLGPAQAQSASDAARLQQTIINDLQSQYYKAVDVGKLSRASIDGMLKSLNDPYTVYMDPRETQSLKEELTGAYAGIGAYMAQRGKQVTITGFLPGSPGKAAGLKPGDAVVIVDGKSTAGLTLEQAVALIKGAEGTQVHLKIHRKGAARPLEFTITRHVIQIPETRTKMLNASGVKVGYVSLFQFAQGVGATVAADVSKIQSQGAQWIVLDLRYDGGGLLDEGINVASDFLTGGVVVSTSGLHSPKQVFNASGHPVTSLPMVVLVNRYTASASEIVTGALKDHQRATIVGDRTFGKGCVQTNIYFTNGASFKLTTAIYLTPNGTDINKRGITPDVVVADNLKTAKDEQLAAVLRYIAAHK